MKRSLRLASLIALSCLQPHAALAAQLYHITDLGDIPGGRDLVFATDLNNNGQVVGYAVTNMSDQAFIWTSDARYTGIFQHPPTLIQHRALTTADWSVRLKEI